MPTVTGPLVAPLSPPPTPPTGRFPAVTVQVMFTPGTWTDISAYVWSGMITRASTRQAGPLITYQPGTLSLVLDNIGGRFDADNLSGPYVATSVTRTVTFTAGAGTWTAPAGITGTVKAECTAAGGGGGPPSGAGAGSGEYAAEPALSVFPGQSFSYSVGAGGTGGAFGPTAGSDGGNTFFGPVIAHGGGGAPAFGTGVGQPGTGSINTVHHDGGFGGQGVFLGGGGGGASSAGPSSAGHSGGAAHGNTGGSAGAAVAGGGPGGAGGSFGASGGTPFGGPGGGGGAAGNNPAGSPATGGQGAGGQISLTYTVLGTVSLVAPMVPIQVIAMWGGVPYHLYYGYVDSWTDTTPEDAGPYYAEVTLSATDAFKVLAGITLAPISAAGAGEDTGTRLHRVLNAARWPAGNRLIDTGDSTLQATTFGSDALSLMQLASDSEIGQLYADGAGNVVFRHRKALLTDARSATPQGVFGDLDGTLHPAGTEINAARIGRANDDTTLANDIQAQRVGGTLQEVTDQQSVSKFLFPRSAGRTDLILQDDTAVAQWAGWVLYVSAGAENRFDSLDMDPTGDPLNQFPQALGREVGDRIQVWKRPPAVASPVSKDCFITGITHQFDSRGETWRTSWSLSSADKYGSFFTIGDPTLGRIGFNAIGW